MSYGPWAIPRDPRVGSEEAKVRAELYDDPFVDNETYGRLVEEAADADERRSWEAEREVE